MPDKRGKLGGRYRVVEVFTARRCKTNRRRLAASKLRPLIGASAISGEAQRESSLIPKKYLLLEQLSRMKEQGQTTVIAFFLLFFFVVILSLGLTWGTWQCSYVPTQLL